MNMRLVPRRQLRRTELGFTLVEMAFVFVLIGIMTLMTVPRMRQVIQASQVSRSASIVASDLEQAFTLAGRFRKPMRISCTCGTGTYTVADLSDGTVRLRRTLGQDSDLGTLTLTWELPIAGTVDVFPSGVSTAQLRVRITSGVSTKAVTLSTAGHVRIAP
jgi:type II secretory pathway pseudopilin PulG